MTEVYFARCGDSIKIGVAQNTAARLSSLRVGSASPIELIGSVKGDVHLERKLHNALSAHRIRGEWFKDCDEVISVIEETIRISDVPPLHQKDRQSENNFAKVAKVLWPHKAADHIAAIAGVDSRTARRWLSGEFDPPLCIVLAVMDKIFGKNE